MDIFLVFKMVAVRTCLHCKIAAIYQWLNTKLSSREHKSGSQTTSSDDSNTHLVHKILATNIHTLLALR